MMTVKWGACLSFTPDGFRILTNNLVDVRNSRLSRGFKGERSVKVNQALHDRPFYGS
jgi:hypothetical protein